MKKKKFGKRDLTLFLFCRLVVAHKDAETLQLAKRACMDVVEIGAQQDGFLFRAQEWTNTKRRAMDLVTGGI